MGVPPETILVVKAIVVIVVCLIQNEEFRKMLMKFTSNKGKKVETYETKGC